jgi:type IV secretion system protein VirB9
LNPINQAPVRITDKEAGGVAITRRWRRARSMPSTGSDGAVVFTFGATQASIVCAPLTVCLLKLQVGEHVLPDGLQIGDKARWHIAPTIGGGDQTILTIKPTDSSLRTTLAIVTNRRVYSIRLVSVPDETHSMAISEYVYPDEVAEAWRNYYERQEQRRQDNTLPNGRNIANLDFNYAISGDNPDWRPERIYSDGIHTYIQFPDRMRSAEMPSLLALGNDGTWFTKPSSQLVNYRRQGNTFLVDKVLGRAELIVGVGYTQQRVLITHVGG